MTKLHTTTTQKNQTTVDIKKFLSTCINLKPASLIIDELKWRYAIRSAIKGKNILFLGPTGCGKTRTAYSLAEALKDRKFFVFNLGATQDAKSYLIGNTHFDKQTGTLFYPSEFVKAIQTENAIILLDEVSRASHDAQNILMTVLDDLQRYLRLDEDKENSVIKVAKGVIFLATANIGNEYTATRVMDRAFLNRFSVKIEMPLMSLQEEYQYLQDRFSITNKTDLNTLKAICEIAAHTRVHIKQEDSKLTNFISTRATVDMAELLLDGFNLLEIAEMCIYTNFSEDGGIDSERTYIKQLVQKYVNVESKESIFNDPIKNSDQPPF